MLKKTLGMIAVLVLILVGEVYWVSQSNGLKNMMARVATGGLTVGSSEPVSVATLTDTEGTVTIKRAGSVVTLSPITSLNEGDDVKTGADGKASIIWPGYGRTIIDSNSDVLIKKASRGSTSDSLVASLRLQSGRVWTRLEKLLDAQSSFDVRASNVVATVRGTSFGVGMDQPGQVDVKVAESHVAIGRTASANSDTIVGQEVLMQPMERMTMAQNAASLPKPSTMTRDEMESDALLMEGNAAIPSEYMDMDWMAFVEMILQSIPPDQLPSDFNKGEFLDYMRQVQDQIPDEVKQQIRTQYQTGQ